VRRINWRLWLLLLFAALCGVFTAFLRILRPAAVEYAKNLVQQTASYAIQDCITQQVYHNRAQYEELVSLERDDTNQVTALRTDTILADYLKVQLARAAYDALNTLEQEVLQVPIGTVFLPTMFAGQGPELNIGIASLGYADADFVSAFTAAGINQTRHQILLEVKAEAHVMTAFGGCDVVITNRMAVTDTVIVGVVPESYTYIDDTEQSLLGKVNDYAEPDRQ